MSRAADNCVDPQFVTPVATAVRKTLTFSFLSPERVLMAAAYNGAVVGVPAALFQTRVPIRGSPYRASAPAPDGQRFLVNTAAPSVPPPGLHAVLD